jgi:hypothetical protein
MGMHNPYVWETIEDGGTSLRTGAAGEPNASEDDEDIEETAGSPVAEEREADEGVRDSAAFDQRVSYGKSCELQFNDEFVITYERLGIHQRGARSRKYTVSTCDLYKQLTVHMNDW